MFSGERKNSAIESTTEIFLGNFGMKKHYKGETLGPLGPPQRHFGGTNNTDKYCQPSKTWSGVLLLHFCYQKMAQTWKNQPF